MCLGKTVRKLKIRRIIKTIRTSSALKATRIIRTARETWGDVKVTWCSSWYCYNGRPECIKRKIIASNIQYMKVMMKKFIVEFIRFPTHLASNNSRWVEMIKSVSIIDSLLNFTGFPFFSTSITFVTHLPSNPQYECLVYDTKQSNGELP